jgi:thiol-disulfide isomerase/thioredoxin
MKATILFLPALLLLAPMGAAQDSPLVAAAKSARRQSALGSTHLPAPDLRVIRWFNSERSSLGDFRGQVLLIDFWATWCGPCVQAHPKVQQLARDLGSSGFAVVLLHARYTRSRSDSIDTPAEEVLPGFIAKHKLVVPVAIAEKGEFEKLGIRGVPHYLLVDRRGFIRYNRAGRLPDESEIRRLLAER